MTNLPGSPAFSELISIFFLIILGYGALVGFIRGKRKALFYFIFFAFFVLIGVLVYPLILNVALKQEINGFSAKAELIEFLSQNNPDLLPLVEEDTLTYSFLTTVVDFLSKHVWVIIILILSIFVLPIITFVFWLFFRKKQKKGLINRLIGALIGLVHSGVHVLFYAMLFAGVSSLLKPATEFLEIQKELQETSESENTYQLLPLEDSNEFGFVNEVVDAYRESFIGKTYNVIKIKNKPIDLVLYDLTFNLEFNSKRIYIREELINLFELLTDVTNDIDLNEKILNQILSLEEQKLTGYVDRLSNLKLINVIFPLGVEVLFNTNIVDLKGFEISTHDYQKLLKLNYQNEIKNIGYVAIDVAKLVDFNNLQNQNILGFEPTRVSRIFDNLGELELVNILAPVGINILLEQPQFKELVNKDEINLKQIDFKQEFKNLGNVYNALYSLNIDTTKLKEINIMDLDVEGVKGTFTQLGNLQLVNVVGPIALNKVLEIEQLKQIFTSEEVDLSNISFKQEFTALGNLYEAFHNLGVRTTKLKDIPFDQIEDEKIIAFSNALYNLQLVQKTTPAVIGYVAENLLPDEVANYIDRQTVKNVNWNGREISSILLLGKLIMANGAADENFDFENLLTEATTLAMAKYMSESSLISQNLTSFVQGLINEQDISFLKEITIEDDFEWTENELYSIFTVARIAKDLMANGEIDFANAREETLSELAEAMANSKIISNNLTPIFTTLVSESDVDLDITVKNDFVWTEREINAILQSIRIVYTYGGDISNLFGISDEDINVILESEIITQAMINYFYEYTKEGADLHGILVVNLSKNDPRWYDQYEGDVRTKDGELRKLIKGLGVLMGEEYQPGDDINFNRLTTLTDNDITILLDSLIINDSLRQKLVDLSSPGGELEDLLIVQFDVDDPRWYDSEEEGELRKLIRSFKLIFGEDFDVNNPDLNINNILTMSDTDLDVILKSQIMSDSLINQIYKLSAEEGELYEILIIPSHLKKYDDEWYGPTGELKALVKGMQIIVPENGDVYNLDIDLKVLYDEENLDTISSSMVLLETIYHHIETSDVARDTLVVTRLREEGEFRRLVKALEVMIPDGDINNYEPNLQPFYDDDNLDTLLSSYVVNDTIIKYIKENNNKYLVTNRIEEDGELKRFFKAMQVLVPDGNADSFEPSLQPFYDDEKLDVLLASYVVNDTIIKHIKENDNEYLVADRIEENGELKRFFKAMQVLVPDGDVESFEPGLQPFYDENNLNTLLDSYVISDTMIKHIRESQVAQGGILVVNFGENDDRWFDKYVDGIRVQDGELRKFIKAIEVILPSGDIENADFSVELMYNKSDQEIETLFASQIITDSVIQEIDANNPGTINTTRIRTPGELPRIIKGFRVLIPGGDIENIDFDIDYIMSLSHDDLDTIISSRVLEDSIIDAVEPMFESGGIVHLYFKTPSEIGSQWQRIYNSDGSLQKEGELLLFIEAIQMMEDAGMRYDQIGIDGVVNSDSEKLADAILHSPLIHASISKMFNQILVDAELHDEPLSPYPIDDREYTRAELIDIINVIKFIASIFG